MSLSQPENIITKENAICGQVLLFFFGVDMAESQRT